MYDDGDCCIGLIHARQCNLKNNVPKLDICENKISNKDSNMPINNSKITYTSGLINLKDFPRGNLIKTDIYKKIYPLSTEIGYIKTIREDGKIDVVMQPFGFENIDEYKQKILDKLKDNYGLLYLSDKSSPEEIKQKLEMSKKNFKKAIGSLYKDKLIEIQKDKLILK